MHRSRLAGFILDCQTKDLAGAGAFWTNALGLEGRETEGDDYYLLDGEPLGLHIEVQKVTHESRVHLDIEADDIDAEATRLEKLGARKVGMVKRWWVMEAPTGQRFCVVRAKRDLTNVPGATLWED